MKKSKLLIASVLVSISLVSTSSFATPTDKTPPVLEESAQSTPIMDWFLDLFGF